MTLEEDLRQLEGERSVYYFKKIAQDRQKKGNVEEEEIPHIPKHLKKVDFDEYKKLKNLGDLTGAPHLCRFLILHEQKKRKPIFESYKTFLFNWGHVEYQEFEFWFMRFSRGRFDLDYDRSKKAIPKATFSDLPMEIIGQITEDLNFEDILSARQVSSGLRSCIDGQFIDFEDVEIVIKDDKVEMQFGSDDVIRYPTAPFLSKPVSTQLINDLNIMLRMRKYQLDSFSILIDCTERTAVSNNLINDFITELVSSVDKRIKANTLRVYCKETVMFQMLLFGFEPVTLEKIQMFGTNNVEDDWHWVFDTDQFQKSKHFDMTTTPRGATVYHLNPIESNLPLKQLQYWQGWRTRHDANDWCNGEMKGEYMNAIFDSHIMELGLRVPQYISPLMERFRARGILPLEEEPIF